MELYPLLYGHVADVYLHKRMYSEALEFYSDVSEVDEVSSFPFLVEFVLTYKMSFCACEA